MSDDVIGSIEGVATFEKIAIYPRNPGIGVIGVYQDDKTEYEAPYDSVFIGGMKLGVIHDEFQLHPRDGDWIWVEATEGELRITQEEPE